MIRFFDVGRCELKTGETLGPACWARFDLIWVHHGVVAIRLFEEEQLVVNGTEGVLLYPDTPFVGIVRSDRASVSVQHFLVERCDDLLLPFRRLLDKRCGYEHHVATNAVSIERDMFRAIELSCRPPTSLQHDIRVAQLALILGELEHLVPPIRHEDRHAERMNAVAEWLATRVSAPPSLDDMAQYAGLSTSHFRVLFRQYMGTSPGHYLITRRLERAVVLLRENRLPIKAIAAAVGFPELSAFYRAFSQRYHMPPAEFRRLHTPRG